MKRILHVVGARPNFIKIAPIMRAAAAARVYMIDGQQIAPRRLATILAGVGITQHNGRACCRHATVGQPHVVNQPDHQWHRHRGTGAAQHPLSRLDHFGLLAQQQALEDCLDHLVGDVDVVLEGAGDLLALVVLHQRAVHHYR